MKIFLIRHGETTGDVEDRFGGTYDDHLTQKGREQMTQTAEELVDKDIEVIFSSSLIRAKESAKIIQNVIGCEDIEILDGFRERHYGILTGLTKKEAMEKYPDAVESHKDPKNTDPEGESLSDFQKRIVEAFDLIAKKEGYERVVVISHGGPIKQILSHLGKNVPDTIKDGEIIELDIKK